MSSPRKKAGLCCRVANTVLGCLLDAVGVGHPKRCDVEVAIETIVVIEECTEEGVIPDDVLEQLSEYADNMRKAVRHELQKGSVDEAIGLAKRSTDKMREIAIAGFIEPDLDD